MAIDFTGGYMDLFGLTQPGGDPFTTMMWAYWDAAMTGYHDVGRWIGASSHRIDCYSNGANIDMRVVAAASTYEYGSITLTTQTWHHIAVTRNGTAIKSFIDGVKDIDTTKTGMNALTDRYIGRSNHVNFDGRMAAFKNWDAELTTAEILQELYFFVPIKSDPTMWTPFVADESDFRNYSGSVVSDWSESGSLGSGSGPPITWRKGASKIFVPAAAAAGIATVDNLFINQAVNRAATF